MRAFVSLLLTAAVSLALVAVAHGQELSEQTSVVPDPERPTKDDSLPASCREHVEVVFWTANRWRPLMRALAANPSPCADYYISIPPADNDKTMLRPAGVYREVRELGPRFHPLAEVTLGGATGWARWVASGNGTWYEAGVEFRRRMALRNMRTDLGETWLLNEFDRSTRLDTAPYTRVAMRELVRGLYEGAPGMAPLPGAAEIGIAYSHQNLPDVPGYKAEMKAWLEDSAFWADMDGKVRWLLREAYADTRNHAVPGTSRGERRRHLEDYQEHLIELVRTGPVSVDTTRSFLEETFAPFVNGGGWVALGGDEFGFATGHGNTEVSLEQMMHFVSEQIYAVRHYSNSHPRGAPAGRIGFSWQPVIRPPAPSGEAFEASVETLAARLAEALRWAYRQGNASPAGACGVPGSNENWCQSEREDASFTDAWEIFKTWE